MTVSRMMKEGLRLHLVRSLCCPVGAPCLAVAQIVPVACVWVLDCLVRLRAQKKKKSEAPCAFNIPSLFSNL